METITVNARRVGDDREDRYQAPGGTGATSSLETDLARARKLATLLDAQFSFAGIPFGLDAIVGLIPVAGDLITGVAALYPLYIARKHKLGRVVEMRMAMNVLVDVAAGAVPLVGDVVDVAFKANLKNLEILERAAEKHRVR